MGVQDARLSDATLLIRGEVDAPSKTIPRSFLPILDHQSSPSRFKGSGRKELAEWIADKNNPLTARVMANRIWQYTTWVKPLWLQR